MDFIKNRIVGHGEEAPDQLLAHPSNFRRHPGAQRDALRGSMVEIGWVKTVIVNRVTGYVVDGHARVEEAMRAGLSTIPVTYVELSEAEEKLALAVLDPISEMATHDDDALKALLGEVSTDDPAIQALLDEIETKPRPMAQVRVEEVDYSPVDDQFWITVRGPLPKQMAALEKLRKALEEIPGVEAEVGTR